MSEQRQPADELIARVRAAARQEQFLEVVSAEEARARFTRHLDLSPLAAETVPLSRALGRVLAADVVAAVETTFYSLEEGIRRYQSPADAQELAALSAENGANRERLQRYIVNLAAEREQEYQVMDKEAQRCRGILTAPARRPGRKK